MADADKPNQDQPKPGETPEGSTVGPQPSEGGNVATPGGADQVVDTGPKAGPNSEGKVDN